MSREAPSDRHFLMMRMKSVLTEVVRSTFPLIEEPASHVAEHVWRDRRYVGEVAGRIVTWQGYRANLKNIDFRYRGIYIDVVDNILPVDERIRLFGSHFAEKILSLPQLVVLFVLDFPATTENHILDHGYIPRRMLSGRVLHACTVVSVEEFLATDNRVWVCQLVKMIILQRFLSIHRKPFEENELPLQHLLYQTGYLHKYFVDNGLVLHSLSRPRPTGHFGHDFHALVSHPNFMLNSPFPVGVEVYVGALGYHSSTIPEYVSKFDLAGLIVISKDDPFLWLKKAWIPSSPIFKAHRLPELASDSSIGIHHLPLEQIIIDLTDIRGRFDDIFQVPN